MRSRNSVDSSTLEICFGRRGLRQFLSGFDHFDHLRHEIETGFGFRRDSLEGGAAIASVTASSRRRG